MKKISGWIIAAALVFLTTVMTSPSQANPVGNTLIGAAVGAGIGQAIGANTEATVIGALAGALLGSATAHSYYYGPPAYRRPVRVIAPPPVIVRPRPVYVVPHRRPCRW